MMILMAVTELERDGGVPVNVVAKLMNIGSSFHHETFQGA